MNDRVSGRVASAADDADRAVLLRVADGQLDALQDLYDTCPIVSTGVGVAPSS